ncbi:MAG: alpha/beta hydrolase [Gammaproteobacteria bacterium]
MKRSLSAVCLLLATNSLYAQAVTWQPSAGHTQVPIWPGTVPDEQPLPGAEYLKTVQDKPVAGKPWLYVGNISRPTMTVYSPKRKNTGAAVVVFPGGGFSILAIDLEGTEICDWLTSNGITCVLLKYRVPSVPYGWQCDCYHDDFALSTLALEDAQRTIGLVRFHAKEWHIDPHKIGVIGFSAGGYLVAEISTNYKQRLYAPIDAADKQSSRPDFAMAIYPGHLDISSHLNPNVPVSKETPPTFLVQAEDDGVDGVNQSLVYFAALKDAGVPAEMHIYAHGGHAFGLRPTKFPITHWPELATQWMKTIGMIPE